MKPNFYNNPLKVIWKSKKVLMPKYLTFIWLIILITSFVGSSYFNFLDFTSYKMENYFALSSTGLTLTLALFVAGKNAFNEEDLKILAEYTNDSGVTGQALIEFLGPYVFTATLFLMTGIISLFTPFIKLELSYKCVISLKILSINILVLGLLSLFNLVITILNDVYAAAHRKS